MSRVILLLNVYTFEVKWDKINVLGKLKLDVFDASVAFLESIDNTVLGKNVKRGRIIEVGFWEKWHK